MRSDGMGGEPACNGQCCAAFTVSAAALAGDDGDYIEDMLIPLTPDEAIKRLGINADDERFDSEKRWNTCRHWDEETRLCREYESRPQMCRDFPEGAVCQLCGRDPTNKWSALSVAIARARLG